MTRNERKLIYLKVLKCISRVEIIWARTNFDGSPLELGIYYRKKGPESPDRPEFHSSFLSAAIPQIQSKAL